MYAGYRNLSSCRSRLTKAAYNKYALASTVQLGAKF